MSVDSKTANYQVETALSNLLVIRNVRLRTLFDFLPFALGFVTTIYVYAVWYSSRVVDVLYLSGGVIIIFDILVVRELFIHFPKTLLVIWLRKSLIVREDYISSKKTSQYSLLLKLIQQSEDYLNSSLSLVFGFLGVLVVGWVLWLIDKNTLYESIVNFRLSPTTAVISLFIRSVFLITGFVGGLMAWRVIAIARLISKLPTYFHIDLQIDHPDGCGGLRPIGDICLNLAYIMSLFSLLVGLWLVFVNLFDLKYLRMTSDNLDSLSSTLLILVIPTAMLSVIGFFMPLASIHTAMLSAKSQLQGKLDFIAQEIHLLGSDLLNNAKKLKPEQGIALEEKMDFLKRVHKRNSEIPTWPFNSSHLARLISTQIIPSIGVASSLLGFVRDLIK